MKEFLNKLGNLFLSGIKTVVGFLTEKTGKQSIMRLISFIGALWLMRATDRLLAKVENPDLWFVTVFFCMIFALIVMGKIIQKPFEK